MRVCVRVEHKNVKDEACIIYFYTYFRIFYILTFWASDTHLLDMCELYMRAPDALFGNVRYKGVKSRNRECVVYKFESGARVRRAALPSHWQRRERGAPAWRQLEPANSSSCCIVTERSRSGDLATSIWQYHSPAESLRVYSCSCRRFSVVLA